MTTNIYNIPMVSKSPTRIESWRQLIIKATMIDIIVAHTAFFALSGNYLPGQYVDIILPLNRPPLFRIYDFVPDWEHTRIIGAAFIGRAGTPEVIELPPQPMLGMPKRRWDVLGIAFGLKSAMPEPVHMGKLLEYVESVRCALIVTNAFETV